MLRHTSWWVAVGMSKKRQVLFVTLAICGIICFIGMHRYYCKHQSRLTIQSLRQLRYWLRSDWFFLNGLGDNYYTQGNISWRLLVVHRKFATPYQIDKSKSWNDPMHLRYNALGPVAGLSRQPDGPPIVWAVIGPGTFMSELTGEMRFQAGDVSIIFVETSRATGHWARCGDLSVQDLKRSPDRPMSDFVGEPSCGNAFHAVFSNGDVVRLRSSMPSGEFAKFADIASCQKMDLNRAISQYRCDYYPRPVDPSHSWEPY